MALRSLFSRTENRSQGFVLPGRDLFPQPVTGPLSVTEITALTIPALYRCVQLVADSGSSLDLDAFRGPVKLKKTPSILEQPDPAEDRMATIGAMLTSLLIHGNTFIMVTTRDSLGFAESLVVLAPDAVNVNVVDGITRYKVGNVEVDSGDIAHARGLTLPGHVLGVSPLALQRRTLGLAIAGEEMASEFYVSGSVPTGVLQSDQEYSKDEAEALKNAWVSSHGGRNRSPAVLSGGVTYQSLGFSSSDLQLLESRGYSAQQICTLYGVPGFLVGVETGSSKTYSSVAQDSALFHRYTLKPYLSRLEGLFTSLLPRGQVARFDLDGLLRASTTERYAAHEVALRAGFMSVDEIREREGLVALGENMVDEELPE